MTKTLSIIPSYDNVMKVNTDPEDSLLNRNVTLLSTLETSEANLVAEKSNSIPDKVSKVKLSLVYEKYFFVFYKSFQSTGLLNFDDLTHFKGTYHIYNQNNKKHKYKIRISTKENIIKFKIK